MAVDYEIEGRVAIVTGASAGMGKASALALASQGVNLIMIARTPERLQTAKEEIISRTNVEVIAIQGDVTDRDLPAKAVEFAMNKWQRVDILINNAGGPAMGTFLEHDDSAWESALDQNLKSVIRLTRAAVPHMIKHKWGRVINISSTLAKEPEPIMVLSATARAGVSAFAKAISIELAAQGITVNTLCPGGVLTDRLHSLFQAAAQRQETSIEDIIRQSEASIPIGRFASPDEFSDALLFLASKRSCYITGTSIMIDGGLTRNIF